MGSVTLDHVTVRAEGASVLLDRVSWTVRPGERWVVLGPNGAGKSHAALETWWHDYADADWEKATGLLDAAGVPDRHRPLHSCRRASASG